MDPSSIPDTAGVVDRAVVDRGVAARVLREVADLLETLAPPTDILRAAQTGRDVLDVLRVAGIAELVETGAYEDEGASTVTAWARRELRIDAHETARLRRTSRVTGVMAKVAEAASAGRLRTEHLNVFAFGLKHIGLEKMLAAEEALVDYAVTHEPGGLMSLVREMRARLHPDDLDQAWLDGMDKEDLKLVRCGDGYNVTGFLGATTGAQLKAVLDSLTKPREAGDERTASERRCAGLSALLTGILDSGVLPADKGVRPHLTVTVPADVFGAAAAQAAQDDNSAHADNTAADPFAPVARLEGFGPIGPALVGYLACLGQVTVVTTAGVAPDSGVLNVGRTRRVATLRQRKAVEAHQANRCATPACQLPVEEIHHLTWWSAGGATDLDNLIG
ncbi:HNH endonuclease signature motif containing protein, partial [Nocardioides massiliensis]